jgi:hypothetical protein
VKSVFILLATRELAALDPALLITPPKNMEVGFIPIVTHQEAANNY